MRAPGPTSPMRNQWSETDQALRRLQRRLTGSKGPILPNQARIARRDVVTAPSHCRTPWQLQRSNGHSPSRCAQGAPGCLESVWP